MNPKNYCPGLYDIRVASARLRSRSVHLLLCCVCNRHSRNATNHIACPAVVPQRYWMGEVVVIGLGQCGTALTQTLVATMQSYASLTVSHVSCLTGFSCLVVSSSSLRLVVS